jgi:hypothetical protein
MRARKGVFCTFSGGIAAARAKPPAKICHRFAMLFVRLNRTLLRRAYGGRAGLNDGVWRIWIGALARLV